MIDYSVLFSNGEEVHFKGGACFSELNDLNNYLDYKECPFSLEGEDKVLVQSIHYHLYLSPTLEPEVIDWYITLLLSRKDWSPHIFNKSVSSIRKNGVIISADIPSPFLLMVLSAFRYLDEFPHLVSACYRLRYDYSLDGDIAFVAAHYLSVSPTSLLEKRVIISGHAIFPTTTLSREDIKYFTSYVCRKGRKIPPPYSTTLICKGMGEHLSNMLSKENNKLSKLSAPMFLKEIRDIQCRMYEFYEMKYGIKKKREEEIREGREIIEKEER